MAEKIRPEDIEKIVEASKELEEIEKELTKSQQARLAIFQKIKIEQEIIVKEHRDYVEEAKKELAAAEELYNIYKSQTVINEEQLKNAGLQIERAKLLVSVREDALKRQEKATIKEISNQEILIRQHKEQFHWTNSIADNLTYKLGMSHKAFKESFFGKMLEQKEKGFSIPNQLKEIGKTVLEAFKPLNIFASLGGKILESTIELAIEENNIAAQFNAATGAAGRYDDTILELSRSNRNLGLEAGDVSNAIQGLMNSFTGFSSLTKETQDDLIVFTSSLAKFGISADIVGRTAMFMTKTLGLSTTQIKKAHMEIMGTAKQLGFSQQKMANDFAAALPKLAVHGDKAVQKFKELAAASKATGMEIDKLIDLAEKFDTFEGAADIVGQLNAIMGGDFLDSMRMVEETDPSKRIKMLQESLKAAGKDFNQLGYYARKSISQILGTSVDELGKIMTTNIDQYISETKKAELSQKELNDMLHKAHPLFDKLKMFALSLAVGLQPLVNLIGLLVDGFTLLNDGIQKITGKYIGLAHIIYGGLGVWALFRLNIIKSFFSLSQLGASLKKVGGLMGGLFRNTEQVTNKLPGLAGGLEKSSSVASKSALSMLAFGAAMLLIGAGVALVVFSISNLVSVVKGMTGGEFAMLVGILAIVGAGFFLMALGIMAVGTAAGISALPMLAFGAAMLLAGAGVALIMYGISLMIKSLTELFKVMIKSASIIPKLVLWLGMMAISITALGLASLIASLSLPGLLINLMLMSYVLSKISGEGVNAIFALGNLFSSMTKITDSVANSLIKVSEGIMQIITAIDKLPTAKSMEFQTVMSSIGKLPELTPTNIANVGFVTEQIVKHKSSIETGKTAGGYSSTKGTTLEGVERIKQPIILELDGRVLKKFVIELLDEKLNPRRI